MSLFTSGGAEFERLRERIALAMAASRSDAAVVVVGGAERGCGVTTVCRGLAAAVARNGDPGGVCVLDASMSGGSRRRMPLPIGLQDLERLNSRLLAERIVTNRQGVSTVALADVRTVRELVGGKNYLDLLAELRRNYAVVLIDAGVAASEPFVRLGARSDLALMVVDARRTSAEGLERARDVLQACGARMDGVVLNRRRRFVPRWLEILTGGPPP